MCAGDWEEKPSPLIVLIEDEGIIAVSCKRLFAKAGFRVLWFPSGEAALEEFPFWESTVAALVLDLDLGLGMDGSMVAREVRKTLKAPIVFHTGADSERVSAVACSIADCIHVTKGAGSMELPDVVERLVARSQPSSVDPRKPRPANMETAQPAP